ncbi:hypothetical protein ACIBK0_51405, partial [Streptomyces sp. NPDC050564]
MNAFRPCPNGHPRRRRAGTEEREWFTELVNRAAELRHAAAPRPYQPQRRGSGLSHDGSTPRDTRRDFARITRIVMRAVFPTKELREEAVEKYHAIEGGEQTLRNLAAY